jgi:adenosyl cobinamide kinase/adenosyl cobinamide phosphate guanylyltransferase
MITTLLGGARSGKTALAVRLAMEHDGPVTYIATSPRIAGDTDLADRIDRHRSERPTTWTTVEAELDLSNALMSTGPDLAIVDCLTLWVNNLLFRGDGEDEVVEAAVRTLAAAQDRRAPTIVVSNEVGLGIVPAEASSRSFRDTLGRVNQRWVAASDRAWFLIAGRALRLHDIDELSR